MHSPATKPCPKPVHWSTELPNVLLSVQGSQLKSEPRSTAILTNLRFLCNLYVGVPHDLLQLSDMLDTCEQNIKYGLYILFSNWRYCTPDGEADA